MYRPNLYVVRWEADDVDYHVMYVLADTMDDALMENSHYIPGAAELTNVELVTKGVFISENVKQNILDYREE